MLHQAQLALFFATLALAGKGPEPPMTHCYTKAGSHWAGGPVPTSHGYSWTPCTVTVTKTTTTTTTAPSTATTTVTSVKTVSTVTTFAAPAQFTPIQDTLASASYDGLYGFPPVNKRDLEPKLQPELVERAPRSPRTLPGGKQATAVTCWTWTHSTCASATKYATAVAALAAKGAPTVTVTSTSTTTTYTSTYYPACQTDNIVDYINTSPERCYIYDVVQDGTDQLPNGYEIIGTITNAYDCCVWAITNPNPAAWWYYEEGNNEPYNPDDYCFAAFASPNCPTPTLSAYTAYCSTQTAATASGAGVAAIGNAYCGLINAVTGTPTPTPT